MRTSILSFVAFIATANTDAILLRKRVYHTTQISSSVLYDRDLEAARRAAAAPTDAPTDAVAPTAGPVMTAPEQPQPDAPILGDNQIREIHRKLGKGQKLRGAERMSARRRLRWTTVNSTVSRANRTTAVGAGAAVTLLSTAPASLLAIATATSLTVTMPPVSLIGLVGLGSFAKFQFKAARKSEELRLRNRIFTNFIKDIYISANVSHHNKQLLGTLMTGLCAILARKELRKINRGVDDVAYGRMSDWKKMNLVTHLSEADIERQVRSLQDQLSVVRKLEESSPDSTRLMAQIRRLQNRNHDLHFPETSEILNLFNFGERKNVMDQLASEMQKEKETALKFEDKVPYLGAGYVEALFCLGKKNPILQENGIRCMIADYLDVPRKHCLEKIVREYDDAIRKEVERNTHELQLEEHADPEEQAV